MTPSSRSAPARLPVARDDLQALSRSFARYLAAANRSPRTIESYQEAIDLLDRFLRASRRSTHVADIGRADIEDFLHDLRRRGNSDNTIAIRYRSIRPFFNFLVTEEVLERSPMAGMRSPAVRHETAPPILSDDVLRRLFRACAGTDFEARRDLAILAVLTDTGIRLGEITGVRMTDLDLDLGEIAVAGKTGARIVPIGYKTRRDLDRYLRSRAAHKDGRSRSLWLGERGPLTSNGIAQMLRRRARQAGIAETVRPHLFRHTFVAAFLTGTDDLPPGNEVDLQRLAGWTTLAMATKYGRAQADVRARRNYVSRSYVDRLRR